MAMLNNQRVLTNHIASTPETMSEIMAQAESEARDFVEQKVRLRQRFAAGGFHVV